MKLEDKIILGCAIIYTGLIAGYVGYGHHIKTHLEPNAIFCRTFNKLSLDKAWMIPKIKNEDMNDNGLYESIFLYKNEDGIKVYQELTRTEEGKLVLGPQKLYE